MMNFIDHYCERLGPGLWAEPLNLLTNIAFFAAAFFAYCLARRENAINWRSNLLVGLTAFMGVGSGLFHSFATLWAMLADTLPILFYQLAFISLYARYVIGLRPVLCCALLGVFFVTTGLSAQLPREWLNGSLEYAPAWGFLLILALWHHSHAKREHPGLVLATLIFSLSLAFRSIDMSVCETIPWGTHFIWHCLNALVLYLTTRAYLLNAKPS